MVCLSSSPSIWFSDATSRLQAPSLRSDGKSTVKSGAPTERNEGDVPMSPEPEDDEMGAEENPACIIKL